MTKAADFHMAAAIRDELQANAQISLRECLAAVQAAYPRQTINPNSFGVAFSNQRAKMGLRPRRGGRKSVRRRKPQRAVPPQRTRQVDLGHLQAARRYMMEVGDADTAIAAVRSLAALQVR